MTAASAIPGSSRGVHRLAIVDIGTNTIKYSVFEIDVEGPSRLLGSGAETVRLGADIDQTGKISTERSARALKALQRFEREATTMGASTLIGVATEAFRSAANGDEILATIHGATRWRLRVIDGAEEARLTFRGLETPLSKFRACVVADVGGGSTELLYISGGALVTARSIPIGSGRFTDAYFAGGVRTHSAAEEAREAARLAFAGMLPSRAEHLPLVLSGGNGTFLEQLSGLLTVSQAFSIDSLHALASELIARPAAQIADVLSISVERASVLPAGCSISLGAVDALESTALAAVPSGIREGVLRDWLDAQGLTDQGAVEEHLSGQVE